MRLLLDTQIVYWWMFEPARVPSPAITLIGQTEDDTLVSRATQWEMAIKIANGKLRIDFPKFCAQVVTDGFSWLAIESRHLLHVAAMPAFADHKDPFDRLLVAQSMTEPLILLTADSKLARYGSTVRVV